jgi:hypothetical protein
MFLPVVHEAKLGPLFFFQYDNITAVSTFSIDGLKAPDLGCRPLFLLTDGMATDQIFHLIFSEPARLEKIVFDFFLRDPARLILDVPKKPV